MADLKDFEDVFANLKNRAEKDEQLREFFSDETRPRKSDEPNVLTPYIYALTP